MHQRWWRPLWLYSKIWMLLASLIGKKKSCQSDGGGLVYNNRRNNAKPFLTLEILRCNHRGVLAMWIFLCQWSLLNYLETLKLWGKIVFQSRTNFVLNLSCEKKYRRWLTCACSSSHLKKNSVFHSSPFFSQLSSCTWALW